MKHIELQPYRDRRFWIKSAGQLGLSERQLEEICFYFIQSGQLNVFVEGEKYVLSKGDALLIPPGLAFCETKALDTSTPCNYSVMGLSPLLFEGKGYRRFIRPLMLNSRDYILKLVNPVRTEIDLPVSEPDDSDWHEKALNVLSKMISYQTNPNYEEWELEFHGLVFILWNTIFVNHFAKIPLTVTHLNHYRRLAASVDYIHEHYNETIPLDTLAKLAFLSSCAYCKYFKKLFGDTPIGYQNNYRIRISRLMLINTDDKISDIAFKCGYNNISHFNRSFKRYMGQTPRDYRKLGAESPAPAKR